jgi:hypothetical protein
VLACLRASFPDASRSELKNLIFEAHKISCARRDCPSFCPNTVLSIIRGSRREIRQGLGCKPVSDLFRKEMKVVSRYPILAKPDPACFLMPNETWAGKGSGGKNNFSVVNE